MATYREIKGLKVPYLDADPPSASASTEQGSVWYNSSTGKLRTFIAFDTWATGNDLTSGRSELAGAGTATAGLVCGGEPPITGKTEEYNGSGWAESGDMNTGRYAPAGGGSQTAAIGFGGAASGATADDKTETYNGSTWTETGDMNTARLRGMASNAGTTTAILSIGGKSGTTYYAVNEEFDGSSWT